MVVFLWQCACMAGGNGVLNVFLLPKGMQGSLEFDWLTTNDCCSADGNHKISAQVPLDGYANGTGVFYLHEYHKNQRIGNGPQQTYRADGWLELKTYHLPSSLLSNLWIAIRRRYIHGESCDGDAYCGRTLKDINSKGWAVCTTKVRMQLQKSWPCLSCA